MTPTPTLYTSFWVGFSKHAEEAPQKVNLKLDLKTDGKKEEKKPEPKPEPAKVGDGVKQEYNDRVMDGFMKSKDEAAERDKRLKQICYGDRLMKGLYKRRPDILKKHMGENPWLAEKYRDIIEGAPEVFRVGSGEWDITK